MRSPGINGEGELRGQPANPGSPGKISVKMECVCVCTEGSPVSYLICNRWPFGVFWLPDAADTDWHRAVHFFVPLV